MPCRKILIIEDDADISAIIAKHLSNNGYDCTQAFSGTEGVMLLDSCLYDMVIMDLMLPGIPGEEIMKLIRNRDRQMPVIIVSARVAVPDKIALLNMGADDYLTKPFDLDELAARVEVQFRKATTAINESVIVYGDWTIDREARTLTVHGDLIPLTRTEYELIELLASHPNKVFTKHELYEMAWDEPYSVEDSTLNVHVSNIRGKLKKSGTDIYIQTVWGLGFKLSNA